MAKKAAVDTKKKFPRDTDPVDVTLALNRLQLFCKNRFIGGMFDRVEAFFNGQSVVGFRFWIKNRQYYWIPTEYNGYYEILRDRDLQDFLQKLHFTNVAGIKPQWWIYKRGNSGKVETETIRGSVIKYVFRGKAC